MIKPLEPAKARTRSPTTDPQAELRRQYVAACRAWRRAVERDGDCGALPIDFSVFSDLICGARGKRTGRPCSQRGLYSNGRCRWHGGLSTGPKTPEGKARSAANYMKRQGRPSEALEAGEVAGRVESSPLGVEVTEAHDAADIPLLPAGAAGVDAGKVQLRVPGVEDPAVRAERAADPMSTLKLPIGSPPEATRRVRPMQAIKDALGCSGNARWVRRALTAERIAAITKLDLGTVEAALRMLVMTRQVERQDRSGRIVYVARDA